ncbi:MAG: hypothetical protein HQL83_17230 [Magnetococcales bacterium]|nr:hypothetical protein [Magnetococcales bacterium]
MNPRQSLHVFDRPRDHHPWEEAFQELLPLKGSAHYTEFSLHVLSRNWGMDHRVPIEREQEMLQCPTFREKSDGSRWKPQIVTYYQEQICRPSRLPTTGTTPPLPPSATVAPTNQTNRIQVDLPSHERLIHVASLNAILWRLNTSETGQTILFRERFRKRVGLPFPEIPDNGDRWQGFKSRIDDLADHLQESTEGRATIQKMAGDLIHALGARQPPWWAGILSEASPFLERHDWTGLSRVLGLGHIEEGEWLLVWNYSVDDAGPLYRPTVVEANDSPYHFPSPPGSIFGITMPLDDKKTQGLRELLHPPLIKDRAEACCTGTLGRIDVPPVTPSVANLRQLRQDHWNRLKSTFKQDASIRWIERHSL